MNQFFVKLSNVYILGKGLQSTVTRKKSMLVATLPIRITQKFIAVGRERLRMSATKR